jgi:hypothetical protein
MKIRSLDFLAQLFASRQKVESNGLNFQLAQSWSNHVDMFIFNSVTLSSIFSVSLVNFQLFTFNSQLLSTETNSITHSAYRAFMMSL